MRGLIIATCCLVLAIFAIIWQVAPDFLSAPEKPQSNSYGKALIGGAYQLTDHTGQLVHHSDFHGKYQLVYFGFTYCPDICPTTLMIISNALNNIGALAEEVTPVFITVDPERDNVDVMAQYVSNFHEKLIGLTGTAEDIKTAADAYKVYYNKVPMKDSATDYVVDHSGFLYFMDRQGNYMMHFPHNVSEQELTDAMLKTINEKG